jgi:hypothetical protein
LVENQDCGHHQDQAADQAAKQEHLLLALIDDQDASAHEVRLQATHGRPPLGRRGPPVEPRMMTGENQLEYGKFF